MVRASSYRPRPKTQLCRSGEMMVNASQMRGQQQDQYRFVGQDYEHYFTYAQRSRIVWEILIRTPYEPNESHATTGVIHLINNGTYKAGFPLHDGPYGKGSYKADGDTKNERRAVFRRENRVILCLAGLLHLHAYTSSWSGALHHALRPIYHAHQHPQVGMDTSPCSTASLPCTPTSPGRCGHFTMLYGLSTMHTNIPSQEICNGKDAGSAIMCPLCDKKCDYWRLSDGCMFSKIIHLFDNPATVGFAVFMSLWGALRLVPNLVFRVSYLYEPRTQTLTGWCVFSHDVYGAVEEETSSTSLGMGPSGL
ncbi:ANO4 [Cordylochernes scorpioides]|uniref:ANO4 n=1 Tax=Cordylochernes scorpioides TaxID=51811 RepID=A0ABY6KK56_9ARAC|nr:ANO4 [Cordylochernes scorpioides]